MFQTHERKSYTLPPKAERIVRRYDEELRQRLAEATGTQCPFLGYAPKTSKGHSALPVVEGCAVIRDTICYRERRSKNVMQLDPEETCPLYALAEGYLYSSE